ncbi:hypothetical protein IRZ71_09200 [Flavobacterium sp. ANB]|uniref:hypothetical protein n=1 Tax=unclassified Flavobacterium TaxID=196869 RepID=UPI0012B9B484|nr:MULTISPECIES: hypothetical protein [unclassified Flavobacterium]MBF4516520.1 hypothetical protein [Flavobacterium sp. ANB]MTD69583.1 hypothetical protein [Flavobacterium sp. LC2016-13]
MKKFYKINLSALFILFWFISSYGQDITAPKELNAAASSIEKIAASDRWVDKFSNQDLVELPVGIRNTVNNIQYSIGITKAVFSPEYTTLTVFCRVDIPQKDKNGQPMQLFFGADNVKLSHQGGIIGEAKLVLLGNVDIPFSDNKWQLSLYGGFEMTTGHVNDLTYVTIDCDGFKEMKVSGAIEFSRDLILPIDPTTKTVDEAKTTVPKTYYNGKTVQIPNRVRGEFSFTASDWNDILVNVSLQPFILKDKRNGKDFEGNFQFLVSNAVLDLSDLKNDPSVVFPEYYAKNALLVPSPQAWKGVFIQTFDIGLPKEFQTTDTASNKERIHVGAQNLIIDKFGVSGTFYADNVFPLDRGITNEEKSWAYSLDHIDVTIAANTFIKANLSGEILLPITKSTSSSSSNSAQNKRKGLLYNGFISMSEQQLIVVTKDSLSFDIWKAKALLLPNSSVELNLVNGRFLPKANLNGTVSFGTNKGATDDKDVEGKRMVDFKGISFENLQLQTVSPIISVRNMGYKGTVAFGNFPVSIGNINVAINGNDSRIDFDLGINLMESIGAGATARIGILGKMYEEGHRQKSRYAGLDLSAINIDCQFSGLKIKGGLILMEKDPVYGNGFNADLEVDVAEVVNVKAKAIFGRTTFRYWYFDAAVKFPSVPAPFMINGFGGGAYYKMHRNSDIAIGDFSPSGLSYTPDEKINLGIKALIYFHIGSETICDGEAGFEIAFNSKGGVNRLAIFGKANVMAKIPGMKNISGLMEKVSSNVTSKKSFLGITESDLKGSFASKYIPEAKEAIPGDLSAEVGIKMAAAIEFDFQNKSMHATTDVYINTPGNFLSGTGPGGRAVWGVFHKDPKDWYMYMGTPDDRCGVKIGVAGIFLKTTSYFMAGTVLPGSPPPPAVVAKILGVDAKDLDYMRDENALANGGGLAFGASLDFDTGDLSFLLFYARFQAGMGFDIMLKDYQEAKCSNTGKLVGINGWYANGQSYAYLQGELGVRIKLAFIKLKVPIISGGAAVLLQAKLPNPVWMRGYVGGNMNVLGGLIKGKFRFKLEIGEECQFENASPLGGIKLITDVTPKQNSTDVDVFAVPQAAFSMKVNEAFVIPEDTGDVTYKVILEKFKVFDDVNEIQGTFEWGSMKDRVNFVSTDILPPNKELKIQVEVSFQKMINGVFQPIKVDGKIATEYEERLFKTGGAPNHIPLSNIKYSYPIVNQKYFLEDEYSKGYIQLKRGQDYLFEDASWETSIKINEEGNSNTKATAFNYNTSSNEVYYDLPDIKQEKKYNFSIMSNLKQTPQRNTTSSTRTNTINDDGNDVQIKENQADALSKAEGSIDRLSYSFNTSKYKTFTSKMNAINTQNYNFGVLYSDVIYLTNTISSQEAFDLVELQGVSYSDDKPIIIAQSKLNDEYYLTDIFPYLYKDYPLNGNFSIDNRDTNDLGIIPAKAIPLNAYYMTSIENDVNQTWTKGNFPFKYNMPFLYKQDWTDLNNQIINAYVNGDKNVESIAKRFLNRNYQFMRYGNYDIIMKYSLPGNKQTTEFTYKYKNANKFR